MTRRQRRALARIGQAITSLRLLAQLRGDVDLLAKVEDARHEAERLRGRERVTS